MKYIFTALLAVCLTASVFAFGGDGGGGSGGITNTPPPSTELPAQGEVKDWTVMVYVCADNDLETFAIKDLNEMEVVGSNDKLNIVAEVDRWDGYEWKKVNGQLQRVRSNRYNDQSNGNWTGTRRYFVTKDPDGKNDRIISRQIGNETEKDMGDPDNLKDFLKWGITNFPARKYLAIVWNHGAGIHGVAFDEGGNQKATHISSNELGDAMQKALNEAVTSGNLKIDITGFDACLMNMYSIAYELKDAGKILLGSEEVEPGDGWPYDKFMAYLASNTTRGEEDIAKNIVDEYIKSYVGRRAATLGAISLSPTDKLTAINTKLDALVDALAKNDASKERRMTALHTVLANVQTFEMNGFIDLLHLCELLKRDFGQVDQAVATAADNVIKEIAAKKLIIANKTTDRKVQNAKGIAIYLPKYRRLMDAQGNRYIYPPAKIFYETEFAKNSKWDDLIKFYHQVAGTLSDEVVGVERI